MNKLQKAFSEISKTHNIAFEEVKRIESIQKEKNTDEIAKQGEMNSKGDVSPIERELDKKKIFWQRIRAAQTDQVSEIIHEAVREKQVIEITTNKELVALVDFFSERGVEGHKVISTSNELEKTELLKKFMNAYCNENRYLMSIIRYDLLD